VIIPKIPVFAGVFDVFWVATIFASDAGHRSIIRGSRRRECVGVGVCGCVGGATKDRDNASTVIVARTRQGERI